MNITDLILLLSLIVITGFFILRDKDDFNTFLAHKDSQSRQRFYRKWTIEILFLYGISALLILITTDRQDFMGAMPPFLAEISHSLHSLDNRVESSIVKGLLKGLIQGIIPILLFGSIIGTIIQTYRANKKSVFTEEGSPSDKTGSINIQGFIPKNFMERLWGSVLSLSAGFSEELFFRLLVPVLLYSLIGSAWIAILGATFWFALIHYYQGIGGVIGVFITGMLLFAVYLISGNIWVAMLVHFVLDFNAMTLSPWLDEYLKSKEVKH